MKNRAYTYRILPNVIQNFMCPTEFILEDTKIYMYFI